MDQVLSVIDWLIDNWQVAAGLVTVLIPPGYSLSGKFIRGRIIISHIGKSVKDRRVDDIEIANGCWMLLAVLLGWGPGVSSWVLDFAPDHQVARLKANNFVELEYRPLVGPDPEAVPA